MDEENEDTELDQENTETNSSAEDTQKRTDAKNDKQKQNSSQKPDTTAKNKDSEDNSESSERKPFNIAELTRDYPELQEYLNSKIGEARKDGRAKGKEDLLKSIGVDDPTVVKELLDAEKARKEAEMSEIQKLESRIEQLQKERDTAQQERQNFETRTRKALIHSEVQNLARDLNFNDPDDLARLVNYDDVEVDLDQSTVTGIKEQAKHIAKTKPYLIKAATQQKPNVPATPQPANQDAQDKAKREQAKNKTWKPSL